MFCGMKIGMRQNNNNFIGYNCALTFRQHINALTEAYPIIRPVNNLPQFFFVQQYSSCLVKLWPAVINK